MSGTNWHRRVLAEPVLGSGTVRVFEDSSSSVPVLNWCQAYSLILMTLTTCHRKIRRLPAIGQRRRL